MTTATIQSVNLLPTYFQTSKNAKFLSSTIDQLIQPAQLERLNAYIGTTSTPTFTVGDNYIQEVSGLRQAYQLTPAMVTYDINSTIQSVTAIDDLANEISIEGGLSNDFDRLFRSEVYPYYPQIDWDKLKNYQNYFWLPAGPSLISIDQVNLDVDHIIVGQTSATVYVGVLPVTLMNGMLITFNGAGVSSNYLYKEFIVEGVGTSINLIPFSELITPEHDAVNGYDLFDTVGFDTFSFDNDINLPIGAEYVTINRNSTNRNPWSRYNRWFSDEVIKISATINNKYITLNASQRAVRPIIEFNAELKLYNFGSSPLNPVDLLDTKTLDAFYTIEGTTSTTFSTSSVSTIQIDGVDLEYGMRVIFAADRDSTVRNKIYRVDFITAGNYQALALIPDGNADTNLSIVVTKGAANGGTTWWFDGSMWVYAQQKTTINQAPLFDLFDNDGISYGDKTHYQSNFVGNKIFGYTVGTGTPDPVLNFPLKYQNLNVVGSFLFTNYFGNDSIVISNSDLTTTTIPTSSTHFKIKDRLTNVWDNLLSPPIKINSSGFYDLPLSLTNNPLNSNLTNFTLSDLAEQVDISTRLISNGNNPIAFAMMFIGKKTNSVIDAITKSADAYNYFKFSLITQISNIPSGYTDTPAAALDHILKSLNVSKTSQSPYYLSDMLAYGPDKKVLTYTVSTTANKVFPLTTEFNLSKKSTKSVLVYVNGKQQVNGINYKFNTVDANVIFLYNLVVGDVITINEYITTNGSFVPPTPTKLGLDDLTAPGIYTDYSYVTPTSVIVGHDGSKTIAFNDFRDAIILEYELRIFNNLKVLYQSKLIDVNIVRSGAFRNIIGVSKFTRSEIVNITEQDFIRWAVSYGIDYSTNTTFDETNYKTWNYTGSFNKVLNIPVSGSWRVLFRYFYDTETPAETPWGMLGFSVRPEWWNDRYGPSPYTAGNTLLWNDLEAGYIAGGDTPGINKLYARPGLSKLIPVDYHGDTLDPLTIGLVSSVNYATINQNWEFGDGGPAETAWRRSSFHPFVSQKLLALTQPATYCALMYDPANVHINLTGQITYGPQNTFLQLSKMPIHGENGIATSGYSVFVSEIGQQRSQNYIVELRQDLQYVTFQLFHKVGGFINPNTLQVIIDAYEPTTTAPGAILPSENYSLILNTSNPINSVGISGIVIQRVGNNFVIKGYDNHIPYFTCYPAIRNNSTPVITVGGVSTSYVVWTPTGSSGANGLTASQQTTARAASTGIFYQVGQIVQYGSNFYRVVVSHQAESSFDPSLYQLLSSLPTTGGATVQTVSSFDKQHPVQITYNTTFTSVQDLYDVIIGYGEWLTDQGFVFDEFNKELQAVSDWNLSAREFLYWSTQNWNENSIISISPFASQLSFRLPYSVVNNIFDKFYEYSIKTSDGSPFSQSNLFIARENGMFTINTINTTDGIYFARLNSVQKEHGIVFDNTDIFGDIIYDIETGERQQRMKLVGFRTANWNGEFFAPGFIYDEAIVVEWSPYTNYLASDVVKYNGHYYSAISNIQGSTSFDITKWNTLNSKPTSGLLPNFDYKASQFNDFYSLDIDNFDATIQQAAQNLTGYTPRQYLNNIFPDPVSQYKFYQGYINEKGTSNAISKLARASINSLGTDVAYREEWAFRVGQYGSYSSYQEFEAPLHEGTFVENPQIISFVNNTATTNNNLIFYVTPDQLTLGNNTLPNVITTSSSADAFKLLHAGYVRLDDVDSTAYNQNSLLDIANNDIILDGTTIWLGFTQDGTWDVLRYTYQGSTIVDVQATNPYSQLTFTTSIPHGLQLNQLVSVVNFNGQVDGIYVVEALPSNIEFTVASTLGSIDFPNPETPGKLFIFNSSRAATFDTVPSDQILYKYNEGTLLWVDNGNGTENNGWAAYKKINNYSTTATLSFTTPLHEEFGFSLSKPKGSPFALIGSPGFNQGAYTGGVSLHQETNGFFEQVLFYKMYDTPGNGNELGYSVWYDDIAFGTSTYGLMFAGAPGAYSNSGTVRVSGIDVFGNEYASSYLRNTSTVATRFGSSIFVQRNTSTKFVLVGAPASTGSVYSYNIVSSVVNSVNTVTISNLGLIAEPVTLDSSSNWGYDISGTDDASIYAISAPGYNGGQGVVAVYTEFGVQTITPPTYFGTSSNFGQSITITSMGDYLAIGAPLSGNIDGTLGAVAIYTLTNSTYVLEQVLTNPVTDSTMNFGRAIDFNSELTTLIISALGTNSDVVDLFDDSNTTFDLNTTIIHEHVVESGSVYLYNRRDTRFVYSEELMSPLEYVISGTNYGTSLAIDDYIIVGSPAISSTVTSGVYQYLPIDPAITGWDQVRVQDNLVLPTSVQQIKFINTTTFDIINYYDYHDPLKGKLLGLAQKELTYQTAGDPAIYSIGNTNVSISSNYNWQDDHVGKLWWDLSTAKFIWYEQGDLEYRRSNWGGLFPGASIDIYEWVRSSLLPSDWAVLADTAAGLDKGISGQPLYVDNSTVSVNQIYDPITQGFSNVYYYWVKNKVTIPDVPNRSTSAYNVSTYISNPTQAGLQFASIISSSSIMLSNLDGELTSNHVSINLGIDNTFNTVPKHTEWVLMQHGSATSNPPPLLEQKMIDSLIGLSTVTGEKVPNPLLSEREKYGISIRPQQTLFKDRFKAMHNIVDFVNSTLIGVPVTGNYDFINLNAAEQAPTGYITVEDNSELSLFTGSTSTVVVLSDSTYNGGWTLYNYINGQWVRYKTQSYNTPLYWKYVDWVSPTFNHFQNISIVVDEAFELTEVISKLSPGQYVKVNNRGDGNYAIFRVTTSRSTATYGSNFDIVYVQNGTIQLLESLWNLSFGWDETYSYNQTLFDQTPDKEIHYILTALKENIFINDLKVNWNNLFYAAVKYAMTEQPSIDWVFKTSFMNVINFAGTLTQPPVYKLQDSSFYEDYINEVKPYHSQIRKFTVQYDTTDTSFTNLADFDVPSYWNTASNTFTGSLLSSSTFVYPQFYDTSTGFYNTLTIPTTENLTVVPWREVSGSIVFDRVGVFDEMGSRAVTDTFIGDGFKTEFVLSWLAQADKSTIVVTASGGYEMPSDYTITYSSADYNGYQKQYSSLIFLPSANPPAAGEIITITYQKSIDLMSAADRIFNFYKPTLGMPGFNAVSGTLTQLMVGAEDPRAQIGGQYEGIGFANPYDGATPSSFINGVFVPNGTNLSSTSTTLSPTWYYSTITTSTVLLNALGINPADLNIDGGYNFIPTQPNQAPEEVLPGYVIDTLGIDVYTKPQLSTPIIYNFRFDLLANTVGMIPLNQLPTTLGSIIVTFNETQLVYYPNTENIMPPVWTGPNQFTIDWVNKQLVIQPSSVDGQGAYTIVGVGDSKSNSQTGIIDSQVTSCVSTSSTPVTSSVSINDVASVYVTVDGIATTDYTLGPANNENNRATVTVNNLTSDPHSVHVWFFASAYDSYNVINQYILTPDSTRGVLSYNVGNNSVALLPLASWPAQDNLNAPSGEAIVELTYYSGPLAGSTVRLSPPKITYYTVTSTSIVTYGQFTIVDPTYQSISASVYKNGKLLTLVRDFRINNNSGNGTITLTNPPAIGDIIGVESFSPNNAGAGTVYPSYTYDYDYVIYPRSNQGNLEYFLALSPNYSQIPNVGISIITFENANGMLIETKQYTGNPYRTFKLDRQVLDENYVWVTINTPTGQFVLTKNNDYEILGDQRTVLISDAFVITPQDTVIIMSFMSPSASEGTMGYRIFNDFLGGTSFTRLSSAGSTYLTQPLKFTDTEIFVANAECLTQPIPIENAAGVILINGERIEFFSASNNILSNIRRATMGTSPSFYLEAGTTVMDQGYLQNIPGQSETLLVQNTFTNSLLSNRYTISPTSITGWLTTDATYVNGDISQGIHYLTSSTIRCDGIKFITSSTISTPPIDLGTEQYINNNWITSISTSSYDAANQIQVFYGGKQLRKDISYHHDTTVSYDSILESQIQGSTSTVVGLAHVVAYPGYAYIITSTNRVWVCVLNSTNVKLDGTTSTIITLSTSSTGTTYLDNSTNIIWISTGSGYVATATMGFVDSGLRVIPADFSIITATQTLILNTSTVQLHTGTLLSIVMKQVTSSWNDVLQTGNSTKSILNSTGRVASFLREASVQLPDSNFYGGDLNLTDNTGSTLLDQNDNPLQGY